MRTECKLAELPSACETWARSTGRLPRSIARSAASLCAELDISLDCLLAAAWNEILGCYQRTSDAASDSPGNDSPIRAWLRNAGRAPRDFSELPDRSSSTPASNDLAGAPTLTTFSPSALFPALEDGDEVSLSYDPACFSEGFIEALSESLVHLVSQIATQPDLPVSQLRFFPVPVPACSATAPLLLDVLAEQVARHPSQIAASFGAERVTYDELDRRSNQLARYLRSLGCGPESLVAVHLGRSIHFLVAVVAVLKAGGAFVPLDAALPEGRIENVLADSQASLAITSASLAPRFRQTATHVVTIDAAPCAGESDGPLDNPPASHDLAYVIYTSGSTGTPKGVMIEHRNLAALLPAVDDMFGPEPGVLLAIGSVSFDISILELLWSLSRGFHVVLHEGDGGMPIVSGPASVPEQIAAFGVTHLLGTPTLMRILASDPAGAPAFRNLRACMVGGEAFPPALAPLLLENVPGRILNAYGPTETTVCATFYEVTRSQDWIPIGVPLQGTTAYVVDKNGRPVPPLAAGELWLGGDLVGRGYLHRPELTAQRFLPDPFRPNGRLYRTGDLVRRNLAGQLEFIDRLDSQVKLRGYRVELGEIEAALQKHPAVEHAVVLVRTDPAGGKSLAAFYTSRGASPLPEDNHLQGWLEQTLPAYMIPAALYRLPCFPMTSNGKIDRARLSDMAPPAAGTKPVRPPADPRMQEIEAALCTWCEQILKLPRVRPDDDFFDIGGESLCAAQLIRRANQAFSTQLRLSELVKRRTMHHLAQAFVSARSHHAPSAVVPLQTAGHRAPLFLIAGLGGNVVNFQFVAKALADRPVYGVEAFGRTGNSEALLTVEAMAATYLDEIRRIQPAGPYHFAGYSFGGVLAFEMAQQLRAQKQEIGFLGLIDTTEWRYSRRQLAQLNAFDWFKIQYGGTLKQALLGPDRRATISKRLKAVAESRRLKAGKRAASVSVEQRNYYALNRYCPAPYPGAIHLFRCPEMSPLRGPDPTLGWRDLAATVAVSEVPGNHESLTAPPYAGILGQALHQALSARRLSQ